MKKIVLLGALLFTAASVHAQESRQDVSVSVFGLVPPQVNGNNTVHLNPTNGGGALLSYRYLVTPHSGLEVNYSYAQNTNYFLSNGFPGSVAVKTRQQEGTVAYVYSRTYRNYNPFVEGGVGGVFYTPILEGTQSLGTKQTTRIGGLFGGGGAYEVSPSFDIRLEYRGLFVKAPSFGGGAGGNNFQTNRYEVVSLPTIGIAYHF